MAETAGLTGSPQRRHFSFNHKQLDGQPEPQHLKGIIMITHPQRSDSEREALAQKYLSLVKRIVRAWGRVDIAEAESDCCLKLVRAYQ